MNQVSRKPAGAMRIRNTVKGATSHIQAAEHKMGRDRFLIDSVLGISSGGYGAYIDSAQLVGLGDVVVDEVYCLPPTCPHHIFK